jgi:hypothetical protein
MWSRRLSGLSNRFRMPPAGVASGLATSSALRVPGALRRFGLDRHQLTCAALTLAAATLLLLFGPPPGDAAVHLYRTFLVESGALVWDNFWYAGHYPLAGYSLLYYLPAALVGNVTLVFAASIAATLLFASITRRQWGDAAIWPSRVFGVCAAAPLFTGLYSYAFGFAAMLAVVWALQAHRTWLAVVFAALTLGFSPLAFVFLSLLLGSALAVRRRLTPSVIRIGLGLGALAVLELVVLTLFPTKGVYPFHVVNLAAVVGVSTTGALLARRAPGGAVIASFFVLWGAGSILASVVASPIGANWTRLSEVVFPVMLLTAYLARFRPQRLAALALAGAFAYNVTPYLLLIPYRLDDRPSTAAYWEAPVDFLRQHATPGFRVEVVPTAAHWESYWIPRAGFPLARGWYRQLDVVDNPTLYEDRLDPGAYRRWLRQSAVEYVLLPSTRLDFVAADQEARLLRSGASGLVVAYRTRDWTIYRLPDPTPLITGPSRARIDLFGHTTIRGSVTAPGRYLLRVHHVPFWKTSGGVCVSRAPGRMTYLDIALPGRFSLTVPSPGEAVLRAAERGGSCRSSSSRS